MCLLLEMISLMRCNNDMLLEVAEGGTCTWERSGNSCDGQAGFQYFLETAGTKT